MHLATSSQWAGRKFNTHYFQTKGRILNEMSKDYLSAESCALADTFDDEKIQELNETRRSVGAHVYAQKAHCQLFDDSLMSNYLGKPIIKINQSINLKNGMNMLLSWLLFHHSSTFCRLFCQIKITEQKTSINIRDDVDAIPPVSSADIYRPSSQYNTDKLIASEAPSLPLISIISPHPSTKHTHIPTQTHTWRRTHT